MYALVHDYWKVRDRRVSLNGTWMVRERCVTRNDRRRLTNGGKQEESAGSSE